MMKYIRTTATAVRKLKQQAKELSKTSSVSLCQALDLVAKEAGYDDFHHVTEMLTRWQEENGVNSERTSLFADMQHPGGLIFEWLNTHYKDALECERERLWRSLQPDEEIDWSRTDRSLLDLISRNLAEHLVAERSLTIGNRVVRIGQLLLNESGDLLSPLQREYIKELMVTPIRPFLVSSVTPGKSVTLVDLVDDEALPIHVAEFSNNPVKGVCFGMRILQARAQAYLCNSIWPFHPSSAGGLFAIAEQANAKRPAGASRSLSEKIIRFFIADTFGQPSAKVIHAATGDELVLTTLHYEVRDLKVLLSRLRSDSDVEQTGEMSFIRWSQDTGGVRKHVAASITADPSQRTLELFTETTALSENQQKWFESAAGNSVRFLRAEQKTATEIMQEATEEEYQELIKNNQEQIPPALATEIFQSVVLETYRDWADKPIPMLDNRSPREVCATAHGKERVRGVLELYEANEREMARRMNRPIISYQFLWDQVGLTRQ